MFAQMSSSFNSSSASLAGSPGSSTSLTSTISSISPGVSSQTPVESLQKISPITSPSVSTSSTPQTSFTTPLTATAPFTSPLSLTNVTSPGDSTQSPSHSSTTTPTEARTTSQTTTPKKSHQVDDGTVAGAIIGVAVGIALITFLLTFLFMRRKRNAEQRDRNTSKSTSGVPEYQADEKLERTPITHSSRDTANYERYLPPSADDKAIEQRTKNTLDQIELHVENYYQNASNTVARPNDSDLASFNSPYLPESLASMLSHSRDGIALIKHVLAYLVISCISPSAKPGSSLLPAEFVGLPSAAASTESGPAQKPGYDQCMSQWRVLSTYLRPDPSENTLYTAHRDRQITELTRLFSRSLVGWKNPKYSDDDRMQHLSAIVLEAVDLGIWLFSQPSGFEFRWPRYEETVIAIGPALVKVTDERGHKLAEGQVVVKATKSKLRS